MFLVVLSLCIASCLAAPSIGYSYSEHAPLSHGYPQYSPYYAKSAYPYGYPFYYNQPYPVLPAPAPLIAPAPLELKPQYHTAHIYGHTSYGHTEPLQAHHAVQDTEGNKVGSFSYIKPDGQVHHTNYVADAEGYRVVSNDLPVAPSASVVPAAPAVPVVSAYPAPTVPEETPEVIAAKAAHFAAYAKALAPAHLLRKRSIYSYASPVVTPNGYISDTPEVAAAKAAHFAEHAKHGNYYVTPSYAPVSNYYSPYVQNPVVTPDGYLADTPEVAAAKAAHLAEKAKVTGHYSPVPSHYSPVSGRYSPVPVSYVPSHPVVSANGHVQDTPEVAAAKAAHFSEYAVAAARSAAVPVLPYFNAGYPVYASQSPAYYAKTEVLPNGYLADTPDVAQAKAAHFAEYAKVASRQ